MDLIEARAHAFEPAVRHPWELARLEVVRDLIARHLALAPNTVVLDVGCGDTFVVEQLAAEYTHLLWYAVDTAFTDELLRRYRARFRTPNVFVAASLDAIELPSDVQVGLVVLMDVLEHVADDASFLGQLLARPDLQPETAVLVTVPAYESLFCGHDEVLGHYRRYSRTQLHNVLQGSGLAVLESGYFFSSLLPMRWLQVVKERLLKRRDGTSALVGWRGGAVATAVLKQMLLVDARAGMFMARRGLPVPGLSSYAVCRTSA
jgi:trans-aconitate methyltransferase